MNTVETVDDRQNRNKQQSKCKKIFRAVMLIIAALLFLVVLGFGIRAGWNFFTGKYPNNADEQKMYIGYTKSMIEGIYGQPDESDDYQYIYYSKNRSVLEKREEELFNKLMTMDGENEDEIQKIFDEMASIEEKLMKLTYSCTTVIFDENYMVYGIKHDAKICDMEKGTEKIVKSVNIPCLVTKLYTEDDRLLETRLDDNGEKSRFIINFTDGSYVQQLGIIKRTLIDEDNIRYEWSDFFGKHEFTEKFEPNKFFKKGDYLFREDSYLVYDFFQFRKTKCEYYLCRYTGSESDITLPKDFKGGSYIVDLIEENDLITSITVSSGVKEIDTIKGCSRLTSITIPNSVKDIRSSINWYGSAALTIYCEASAKPSGWAENWKDNPECENPVVWNCKNNDVADDGYIYTVYQGLRYKIKDGTAAVAIQPSNQTCAEIPASITYKNNTYSVTKIADSAFAFCGGFTSLIIPDSVKTIDNTNGIFNYQEYVTIEYSGTKEQWEAVEIIGRNLFFTVHCTNGNSKEKT